VVSLYTDMEEHGIRLWLVGGWGVDALLGRQTRHHHDVDVLVEVKSLECLRQRLDDLGYAFRYLWEDETWWVHDASWSGPEEHPTAFVYGHSKGREIDVHVLRMEEDGAVVTLWNASHRLTTDGLQGRGLVAGHCVRCLTADMQRTAHTGYELPAPHVVDLQLLAAAPDGRGSRRAKSRH